MNRFIDNAEKMYEGLSNDCDYRQFLRELIMNAIQAGASRVTVDESARYPGKIEVRDDGPGICDKKMIEALFYDRGSEINHGIGGRVASMKRSPLGIEYQTACSNMRMGYRLILHPLDSSREIDASFDEAHGTAVTLYGRTPYDDTIKLPEMQEQQAWNREWAIQYVNSKFWNLEGKTAVFVRDFSPTEKENGPRRARGLEYLLNRLCPEKTNRGETVVYHCNVLWYILPDKLKDRDLLRWAAGINQGAVAILHENELYALKQGRDSNVSSFGIQYASHQVVLILKPWSSMNAQPNQMRTAIERRDAYQNTLPFDYAGIAEEFRKCMPKPLRDFQNRMASRSNSQKKTEWDQKLFNLFCDVFSEAGKRRRASAGGSSGSGGLGSGKDGKDGTGHRGFGNSKSGYKPDPDSKEEHKTAESRGLPRIDTPDFVTSDGAFAFNFTCNDRTNYSDMVLTGDTSWPGWKEHADAIVRYGRDFEAAGKMDYIYGRAIAQAKSAIYCAVIAEKNGRAGTLDACTSPEALTSVAASIRLNIVDFIKKSRFGDTQESPLEEQQEDLTSPARTEGEI